MANYIEKQLPFHNRKRVEFVSSIIAENIVKDKEYNILDVGCGTGELFTIPLAVRLQRFENIKILGIDIHFPSIERARHNVERLSIKNLTFECKPTNQIKDTYNCVCLMAVLEHLTNPKSMIAEIKKRVRQNGFFILYIPNGYGDYEIEFAILKKLRKNKLIMRLYRFLKNIKYSVYPPPKKTDNHRENTLTIKETLNDPNNIHIQFFKLKRIKKILRENGFLIKNIFKVHFIAGPISRKFFYRFKNFEKIDHKIASKIPNIIASDWTFICKKEQ